MTDLADYLLGDWRVERALHDSTLGDGSFTGEATFTRDEAAGLRWEEHGRLTLGSYDGPATRVLKVIPDADGWAVQFADGRPFHRLDLDEGRCSLEHPCGDDAYTGEFAIHGPDAFAIGWRVRGPAKDQQLAGSYVRA